MTSNSFKKGFTMMILKVYNSSLMMILKRFKMFHNSGIKAVLKGLLMIVLKKFFKDVIKKVH